MKGVTKTTIGKTCSTGLTDAEASIEQPSILHDDDLEWVIGGAGDGRRPSGTATTGYFSAGDS